MRIPTICFYLLFLPIGAFASYPVITRGFSFVNLPAWLEFLLTIGLTQVCGLSLQGAVMLISQYYSRWQASDEESKEKQKVMLLLFKILWAMAVLLCIAQLLLYFIVARHFSDILVQQLIVLGGTLLVLKGSLNAYAAICTRREQNEETNR